MFKLSTKSNVNAKEHIDEVFVAGNLENAISVATKLLETTSCEIVEVFKKSKGEIVAVLSKAAMTA